LQLTEGFFAIEGLRLEYQLHTPDQSQALTLVLLHEGLGCVALWKEFPRQLAALSGCRVLSYSRAGYGGSDPCALPRPLRFMHHEGLSVLPKILAAAGIEQAVLVGHSDGASIALIHTGALADSPIQGLVLMAPHVFVEELTVASIRQARDAYAGTDLRQRLQRYHGANVDCAFLGWSGAWLDPDFLAWNLEEYLPTIDVPVLLIQGEEDNYGTLRQLDAIEAQLPGKVERIILPACGHSPFRDQPEKTLQASAAFLKNLLEVGSSKTSAARVNSALPMP
jgi:pimeloyl-ACP methyl ester carboxylesterase